MSPKTTRFVLVGGIVVAVVLVAVLLLAGNPGSTPASSGDPSATLVSGLITPLQYTSEYVDGGAPHQLIDVRTPEEFAGGHLPNAVNIPLQEIASRLDEVTRTEPVVLYCRSGNRSNQAAQLLGAEGFSQVLDLGGIQAWEAAGLPVIQ